MRAPWPVRLDSVEAPQQRFEWREQRGSQARFDTCGRQSRKKRQTRLPATEGMEPWGHVRLPQRRARCVPRLRLASNADRGDRHAKLVGLGGLAPIRGPCSANKGLAGEPPSVDHLVSPCKQGGRHSQPVCPCRLEVYDQLELGGLLDGQVSRLGTLQDLVHVNGRPSEHICHADGIRAQPAGLQRLTIPEHRRELSLAERFDELCPVIKCERLVHDEHGTDGLTRQYGHVAVDVRGTGQFPEFEMQAECRRRGLQLSSVDSEGRIRAMPKNADPCCSWNCFLQEL